MKSQDIPIIGILLAIGAIVRYLSLMIPGPIVSNLVIAFYCLAIVLVIPTVKESLGIGIVAGIICAMVSHSIFPPGNLVSEPVGALVCLLTFLLLRSRIVVAPGIATLLGTLASGCTFVAVAMLMMSPAIASKYMTMGAFVAAIIPIVMLTAVANGIIAQILFIPASRALQRLRTGDTAGRMRPPAPPASSPGDEEILRASDFSYTYEGEEQPALRHVDATLRRGEVLLVTGPTAAGKTTLCLAFAGVLHHESGGSMSGDIALLGRDIGDFDGIGEVSRHTGMMFDDADAQLIFTSVEEEMRSGLENRGLDPETIETRITSVMEQCGISDLRLRAPHTLSGGQKQRVALAVTLALDPEILILDESMSELDVAARGRVISLLGHLKAAGKTIIVVDHSIEDLCPIADQVIVMDGGAITLRGSPEAVGMHLQAKKENKTPDPVATAPGAAGGGTPVLSVKELCQYYGSVRALDSVSFDIYPGEFVAIVGENGSGKTTLVKHFNGLLRPQSGKVTVSGVDAGTAPVTDLVSHAGLVFQNPDTMLFENTVADEVGFGVMNTGADDPQGRIALALDLVHLAGKEAVYPRHLSRGERQRLAVACVLAMQPEVIILDEPTTGLDDGESGRMMELMKALQQRGHTIVMVTHNMRIVETYAGRVIRMEGGRIEHDGPGAFGGACT